MNILYDTLDIISGNSKLKIKYNELNLNYINFHNQILDILISKCELKKEYNVSNNTIKEYVYNNKINLKVCYCNDTICLNTRSSVLLK